MPDPLTKPALPAAPKTKTFVIAKRRTLTHGTPKVAANEKEGTPEVSSTTRHYHEGEKIELPIAEGEALQEAGFLVNDDGSVTMPVGGPPTVNGVEIKEQA